MFIQNNVIIYFASKLTAIIIRKIKERETGRKNFFYFKYVFIHRGNLCKNLTEKMFKTEKKKKKPMEGCNRQ